MGIQVTREGKILVGGERPRGIRTWLRARIITWHVGKLAKQARARAGMSEEERAALDRDEFISICRRRQALNGFTCVCAAVNTPIVAYSAWTHSGFWFWACAVGALLFAWRAIADYKRVLALRQEERELVVDDVHDF